MQFLSTEQKKAYATALSQVFKAVAFDMDGTLTPLSRFLIPRSLKERLITLPDSIALAICTGRPIDYIAQTIRGLYGSALTEHHRQQWYVFSENGGAGYLYKPKTDEYDLLYEIPWPTQVSQDSLECLLKQYFGWKGVVRKRKHSVVLRYPTWFYLFPRFTRRMSARTAKQLHHLFEKEGLNQFLQIADSGIGNLIFPKGSGKGKAMQHWARHLGISLRELLVVGDQPRPGENDEEFLSGHYGTAFTVGPQTAHLYPLPVLDERGRKLYGPQATQALLDKVMFKQ